jgi:hypothetical protein
MRTNIVDSSPSPTNAFPLLDASNLPSADDWALLEAIRGHGDIGGDLEPDFDRFGRFRVAASFDE